MSFLFDGYRIGGHRMGREGVQLWVYIDLLCRQQNNQAIFAATSIQTFSGQFLADLNDIQLHFAFSSDFNKKM